MPGQISILPPIYEDEAIGYYLLRVQALSGNRSVRDVTRELFGHPSSHIDWALPCNLAQFAKSTSALTQGADAEYWMLKHTLLPYYAATACPSLLSSLRSRMLHRQVGPMRQWHALTVGELTHGNARYCPSCAAQDLEQLGVRYVRTFHLLPNVSYCPVHATPLITLEAASLLSPRFVDPPNWPERAVEWQTSELRFARQSLRLQQTGPDGREAYFLTLQEAGWWNGTKLIRRARIRESIREFWRGDYIDLGLEELTQSAAGLSRVLGCFGTKRKLVHPVAAALVRAACEAHGMEPASAGRDARQVRQEYQHRLEMAIAALDAGASLRQAATEAQVSVTSLATAAEASGRFVKRRPKLLKPELLEKLRRRLLRGENPSTIAIQDGVSLSTVYRIRRTLMAELSSTLAAKVANEALQRREFWLKHASAQPTSTVTQLRVLMPATYVWLYRHDREWLLAQNASRHLRYPTKFAGRRTRRHDLSAILASTAHALLRSLGKPVRLTPAHVHRSAGFTFVRDEPRNYPVDTKKSFLARRISWAKKLLANHGFEQIEWRVFRKAGLRPQSWLAADI